MTSPDVHTLTGAYVLGALSEHERRQFERHLAECPECRQEVAELRATTVRLGLAVSEAAPAALKQRVLAEISEVRQEPPMTGHRKEQRERPTSWPMRLVSVAAAIGLAVAIASGVLAYQTQSRLDSTRDELAQSQSRENTVAELLAAPDLRAISGRGARDGEGSVMVSRQLDRGMLLVHGMPAQPANATYQAWAIVNGTPKSIGVLGPSGTTATPLLFQGLTGVNEVAMTVEPAGGSARPTTSPAVVFPL